MPCVEQAQLGISLTWIVPVRIVQRMLSEDELRDALLLVFANKQVSGLR